MKQIYFLTLILFSLYSYSQNCNIGNEAATSDFIDGGFSSNYLLGVKYTLNAEGTLNSINLIGNGTGEGIQMAVYDDNSGVPNNLIASSSLGTVGSGITSLPITPTLLPAGDYWIMAVYDVGGNSSDYNSSATGNTVYYQSLSYGSAIPTNASSFFSYTGQDFLYFLGIDCGNTLSIENFNLVDKISIFPNPTSDYISISNLENLESYLIVNQLGQEMKRGIISNQEKIDIRNFTNGLYFLKLENGNTIKFIKK
jgi:hypothetical protein